MGETDDKESVPVDQKTKDDEPPAIPISQNEIDDATETDKMLKKDDLLANENNGEEKKDEEKKSQNGDDITKAPETASKLDAKEREVKPRKIPIGGIKMPGFFTKNKPTKDDGADGELLENAGNEAKVAEETKTPAPATPGRFDQFLSSIRARNPFRRQPKETNDEEKGLTKEDDQPPSLIETAKAKEAEEKPAEESKKPIFGSIKAPLSNIIPKRFKSRNSDIEMGNGPNTRAGLASVETLDDSQKDIDKLGTGVPDVGAGGDQVDRANPKSEDGMENIKLDNGEKEKDIEKDDPPKEKPPAIMERIRNARCTSTNDLAIIGGIILFLIIVAIILIFTFTGKPVVRDAPLRFGKYVDALTTCGTVEGVLEDSAYAFRGVPYGIPPIGENRWRPAELITNIQNCWNGTFKAHNSTTCLQKLPNGTIIGTEDCLTLDVITPHIRYYNPLPVVVLIGADTMMGASPNKLRPSTRVARDRDIVFVRPNFRLGPFGFLALEELSNSAHPPTSGNYGLSDLLAVLRWIDLNIVHFGGNKNSVTLLGHGAGATLVTELVTSPLAKGLFTRAWVTSGSAIFPGRPLSESERANAEYLTNIGCSDAQCLRKQEPNAVMDAVPADWLQASPDLPMADENSTAGHNWLVMDGDIIQKHPADVWNNEPVETGPTKMVIGTTAHVSHSEKLYSLHKEWTPELVREHIEASVVGQMNLTDEALKLYPETYEGLVRMISDIRTVCPLLTVARQQPTAIFYVVTQPSEILNMTRGDDDITAIVGRYEPRTPEQRRYLSQMQHFFYYFVQHGEIPKHEPRKRRILNVAQDLYPVENYSHCDFWIQNDIVPRYAKLD